MERRSSYQDALMGIGGNMFHLGSGLFKWKKHSDEIGSVGCPGWRMGLLKGV